MCGTTNVKFCVLSKYVFFSFCRPKTSVLQNLVDTELYVDRQYYPQVIHDAIIMSLLRQNDVATSFWHNNDFVIALRVDWELLWKQCCVLEQRSPYTPACCFIVFASKVDCSISFSLYLQETFDLFNLFNWKCSSWGICNEQAAICYVICSSILSSGKCVSNVKDVCGLSKLWS